jgi:hypothetical protein
VLFRSGAADRHHQQRHAGDRGACSRHPPPVIGLFHYASHINNVGVWVGGELRMVSGAEMASRFHTDDDIVLTRRAPPT